MKSARKLKKLQALKHYTSQDGGDLMILSPRSQDISTGDDSNSGSSLSPPEMGIEPRATPRDYGFTSPRNRQAQEKRVVDRRLSTMIHGLFSKPLPEDIQNREQNQSAQMHAQHVSCQTNDEVGLNRGKSNGSSNGSSKNESHSDTKIGPIVTPRIQPKEQSTGVPIRTAATGNMKSLDLAIVEQVKKNDGEQLSDDEEQHSHGTVAPTEHISQQQQAPQKQQQALQKQQQQQEVLQKQQQGELTAAPEDAHTANDAQVLPVNAHQQQTPSSSVIQGNGNQELLEDDDVINSMYTQGSATFMTLQASMMGGQTGLNPRRAQSTLLRDVNIMHHTTMNFLKEQYAKKSSDYVVASEKKRTIEANAFSPALIIKAFEREGKLNEKYSHNDHYFQKSRNSVFFNPVK